MLLALVLADVDRDAVHHGTLTTIHHFQSWLRLPICDMKVQLRLFRARALSIYKYKRPSAVDHVIDPTEKKKIKKLLLRGKWRMI